MSNLEKLGDADLAGMIDHTLLKPEATVEAIEKLCAEAIEYRFASVCINPSYVITANNLLKDSSVAVCTVVGFPLGAHQSEVKADEARLAIWEGASEIDMVINIGALKSGDIAAVEKDIRSVSAVCLEGDAICKVIIETSLLNDAEKREACLAAARAKADFVKTSTGFAGGGATVEDIQLMSGVVRPFGLHVKASGGIRNREDALKMIAAGASRIGASAGIAILNGEAGQSGY